MKHSILNLIGIVLFFVSSIFCLSAFSQSYQDGFDVLREKNWEHWGKYAIWRVEDGFLKGWTVTQTFWGFSSHIRTAPI